MEQMRQFRNELFELQRLVSENQHEAPERLIKMYEGLIKSRAEKIQVLDYYYFH